MSAVVPGEFRCDLDAEQERRERRERWVVAAASGLCVAAGGVVLLRCSPDALRAVAGSSQLGRALRRCGS